ncbi:uncharacterized protein [Henckelia pumila]|uniref:uncharacterized protein isoform X3 n=1 Tax=Henckelia pumila TaxID=405737 RepID=UPI003C6E703C
MASMASPNAHFYPERTARKPSLSRQINLRILSHKNPPQNPSTSQRGSSRRELILRSSEIAVLGAIFHFRNYNPEEGRGSKNPASKEQAMKELLDVIKSTKPENFSPKITEKTDDYVRVEYESPIMGFVDDAEFWFPPGKKSIVQYRSASRLGNFDFDVNRKRIKYTGLEASTREEGMDLRKQLLISSSSSL